MVVKSNPAKLAVVRYPHENNQRAEGPAYIAYYTGYPSRT